MVGYNCTVWEAKEGVGRASFRGLTRTGGIWPLFLWIINYLCHSVGGAGGGSGLFIAIGIEQNVGFPSESAEWGGKEAWRAGRDRIAHTRMRQHGGAGGGCGRGGKGGCQHETDGWQGVENE